MDATFVGHSLVRRPAVSVVLATAVAGYFALSTTPSFAPLAIVLAAFLVTAHDAQQLSPTRASFVWLAQSLSLTIGATLARLSPSIDALSTPAVSLVVSAFDTATHTAILFALVQLSTKITSSAANLSPWMQLLVFPTLYTSTQMVLALSPVGRLLTWTPADGYAAYAWTLPFFGVAAIDWLVASWAVVLSSGLIASQDVETPYRDDDDDREDSGDRVGDEHLEFNGHKPAPQPSSYRKHVATLIALLVVLAVPSYFHDIHTHGSTKDATFLPVACILPPPSDDSALIRYVNETKTYSGTAQLVVWPEAAVTVSTKEEKENMISSVQAVLQSQTSVWVAISYLERLSSRNEKYRNAVSIVNHAGLFDFEYAKRQLVPR